MFSFPFVWVWLILLWGALGARLHVYCNRTRNLASIGLPSRAVVFISAVFFVCCSLSEDVNGRPGAPGVSA